LIVLDTEEDGTEDKAREHHTQQAGVLVDEYQQLGRRRATPPEQSQGKEEP
jgi:hypothetical protein